MKNITTLIIIVFSSHFIMAQNEMECEKIVLQTYEAINQKNADSVIKYLSDDFSIAGQTGELAKIILSQIFEQLNMKVSHIKKIESLKTDALALVYEAEFGDKGRKKSTFVFDEKNQLKSLELLPMQVMNKGNTGVKKNVQSYFTIPFKRMGNLIAVQVKLNGVFRTFLVDNGSPILILNSAHIRNDTTNNQFIISSAKGAGGNISNTGLEQIKSFEFGGIKMDTQKVITMDLSHLEKEKNSTFYGLIGYEVFKDYDLMFDYKKSTITFIKPEASEDFIFNKFKTKKQIEVALEMKGHIPMVTGFINGEKYALGLDCGAESSLFDIQFKEQLKTNMTNCKTEIIIGADKNKVETLSGKLNLFVLGGIDFKKTEISFSDISHLNEGYKFKLDGLIGYDILSRYPTLVSFINKKVIFFR